ncbi:MAG: alpha-2-macroglobulin family protein [Phycisphaerae bacterium]
MNRDAFEDRLRGVEIPEETDDAHKEQLKQQVLETFAAAETRTARTGWIRQWLGGTGKTRFTKERDTMKRPTGRFALVAAILIAVNVGGWIWLHHSLTAMPTPRMRVLHFGPDAEPTEARRLTLLFDDKVVSPEQVGTSPQDALFVISPAPKGQWQWTGRDKLEYILAEPLPPGHRFEIQAAADIETRLGRKLVGLAEFAVQTPALELKEYNLLTADGSDVTFQLDFNQPVAPEDLAKHLEVYVDNEGQALQIQQLTKEPAERHVIRVAQPAGQALRFSLSRELTGHGGKLPLGQTRRYQMHIPERMSVTWSQGYSYPSGRGRVMINFSKPLAENQPFDQIQVTPAVEDLSITKDYRSRVTLRGRFKPSQSYRIKLPATMLAADSQTLQQARTVSVHMPALPRDADFAQSSGVLSPTGNMTLDVTAVNVGTLTLNAHRVYPNNLVAALTGHDSKHTAREVLADKTFQLDLQRNEVETLAVDLGEILGRVPGLYQLSLKRDRLYWTSDRTVVCVSDLAITAKKQATGYLVWVTSLSTGKPVPDAEIVVRSRNNQILGRARSDADGLADVRCNHHHPAGPGWLITASKDQDTAWLRPDQSRWMLDHVETAGRNVPESYDVMLYAERGVYRPGDTIHLTGIIRDPIGRTPEPFPLEIRSIRPDGRPGATLTVVPDPDRQGVFHVDFPTAGNCRTGPWRFAAVLPGSKEPLGQTHAFVEAFLPVRMAVELEASAEHLGPGGKVELTGSGRYLWGKAAEGLAAKLSTRWNLQRFESSRYPDMLFDAPATRSVEQPEQTAELDADGQASFAVSPPESLKSGLWQATHSFSVTQDGGRTVSAGTRTMHDLSELHVGLALPGGRRVVPGGRAVDIRWARATWDDKPAAGGEMTLTVSQILWDYNVRVVDGRPIWQSHERMVEIDSRKILAESAEGQVQLSFEPGWRYRLRLSDGKTGAAAEVDFYAGWAGGDGTPSLSQPERCEVVLDRQTYQPGQKATVVLRSAVEGRALLTMETDRVLLSRVVEMQDGQATVEVPIPADLRGGAFVAASVIRPLDAQASNWKPHRAMGLARIKLEYPDRSLPLTIEAPGSAEPSTRVDITVQTDRASDSAQPAVVHLWAVDEGICRVTGFGVPSPREHFLADRRLAVESSDSYFQLLPDYKRPAGMTRIGAGGPEDSAAADPLRRNPVPTRRRDPDVVWRQAVIVGPDGAAHFQLPMPQLYGRMRLMAVAVDGDRYAAAESGVTLKSELMVEASWPRFAAPGDEFRVPVRLTNTGEKMLPAQLHIDLIGPLEVTPDRAIERIEIAADSTETIWLNCKAILPGPVEGLLVAREIAKTFDAGDLPAEGAAILSMPIRPGDPLHGASRIITGPAGREMTLRPSEELIEGTRRRQLEISASPQVQLLPTIEKLLRYPHGCVEQTTSTLYPLLYAPDLIGQSDGQDVRIDTVSEMIYAGLGRLWSMQTTSGGLAYWPGGHSADDWGTAYAAGAVLEAAQAGYRVDPQFTGPLMDYIHRRLNAEEDIDSNTRALFCRVLARFGKPAHGWMAKLAEGADRLDLAGRAHLAAALAAAGRRDQALKLLTDEALDGRVELSHAGRITSQPAQEATMLRVLLDIAPSHAWVPALASRLTNARKDGHWATTITNAQALAAMSKYQVLKARAADFAGKVTIGQRVETFASDKPLSIRIEQGAGPVTIESTGSGDLFIVSLEEGLAEPGVVKPHDRGLRARRTWLDRDGKAIDPAKVRVGDLVYVEVHLSRPAGASVENIAVVDALPGGFEVENPRLVSSAIGQLDHPSDLPQRIEFLDDRVVLFDTASREAKTYRYALRATTAGTFLVPGLQASAMYDPSIASLTEAGEVIIRE